MLSTSDVKGYHQVCVITVIQNVTYEKALLLPAENSSYYNLSSGVVQCWTNTKNKLQKLTKVQYYLYSEYKINICIQYSNSIRRSKYIITSQNI